MRFTANLPLVNIPWTACKCTSDPWLQREAEPHKGTEPDRVNWLQAFPLCLPQPCLCGASVLTLSSYCSYWERFHWLRVHETSPCWSHTAWKRERQSRMWSVNTWAHTDTSTTSLIYGRVWTGPPAFYWRRWYLVVHDCSQAHDANMHVVLLAHESGVLDGSAAGNWAVAGRGRTRSRNQTLFFFFLHDIKCLTVASFMYCEWSGVPSFQEWERERENYRQVRLTRKKKKVWGCRCIVGEARFPCRCGRNTCCYVRVLHIHFSSAVYNLPTRHFKVHHVWNIQTHPNRLLPNLRSYKTTERFITKSIMRETVYYQRNTYIVNIHIAVIHLYYFIIFCLILYNEN